MDFLYKYLAVIAAAVVIAGAVVLFIVYGNRKKTEAASGNHHNDSKQNRLSEIKKLEETLRNSEEHKRRRESALQMLELLVQEEKAKKIINAVDDKLEHIYDEACQCDKDGSYNYLISNASDSINEKDIFLHYMRREYFRDHYIENFITKGEVLSTRKRFGFELEVKEDCYILKKEDSEGIELDNHFTRRFLEEMAKTLGYDDLVFPDGLDGSLKEAVEINDCIERILPYLKPQGYIPIFFHSCEKDKNAGFYKYTVIPEEKYEIIKKLLEDSGYIVIELPSVAAEE